MEKEIQRKYLQLQMLKQQFNAYNEEKAQIDEKISGISITINSLEQIKSVEKGSEIWSSLGSGLFVASDIRDAEKILVNVGAGVVLKKGREESIGFLREKLDEVMNVEKTYIAEMNKISQQANMLEAELQKMAEKHQKGG